MLLYHVAAHFRFIYGIKRESAMWCLLYSIGFFLNLWIVVVTAQCSVNELAVEVKKRGAIWQCLLFTTMFVFYNSHNLLLLWLKRPQYRVLNPQKWRRLESWHIVLFSTVQPLRMLFFLCCGNVGEVQFTRGKNRSVWEWKRPNNNWNAALSFMAISEQEQIFDLWEGKRLDISTGSVADVLCTHAGYSLWTDVCVWLCS